MDEKKRLDLSFYSRNTVEVAQDLLGKTLVFGNFKGIIVETEAYRGLDDEASHASRGPTPRSSIMFGEPGYSYVYLIYGMYNCLNFVTETVGVPGAVLIRGLYLPGLHLNGPGKLCQYLGITRQHNGINLTTSPDFYVTEGIKSLPYKVTPRIGIKKSIDKLWRFIAVPNFEG